MRLRADWADAHGDASGTVNMNTLVNGPTSFSVQLEPSQVDFGQGQWHNERIANIEVDSSIIHID